MRNYIYIYIFAAVVLAAVMGYTAGYFTHHAPVTIVRAPQPYPQMHVKEADGSTLDIDVLPGSKWIDKTFRDTADKSIVNDLHKAAADSGGAVGDTVSWKQTMAPMIDLMTGQAQGGVGEGMAKLASHAALGLIIAGIAICLIGVALMFTGVGIPISVACWALGGSMIFAGLFAQYAAWALGIGGLGVLAVAVYFVIKAIQARKITAAAQSIVPTGFGMADGLKAVGDTLHNVVFGLHAAPAEAKDAVLSSIDTMAAGDKGVTAATVADYKANP
jgi:hypothetical protein